MIFCIIEIVNDGIKLFISKNITEIYKVTYILLANHLMSLCGSIITLRVPLLSALIGISRCVPLVPVKRRAQELYFE